MNNTLLRQKINECGITITTLSAVMECSRQHIYNGLDGKHEWTIREALKLKEVLDLDSSTFCEIFLGWKDDEA